MRPELKVGALFIAAALALGYMLTRLNTGGMNIDGGTRTYYVLISDATGLTPRSQVKVAGIGVGQIQQIELKDKKALVTLELGSKLEVHTDATAKLKMVGYLGDKYLSISPGSEDLPLLPENSRIPLESESIGMEALTDKGVTLAENLNTLLESLNESLGEEDESGRTKLSRLMTNLTRFSEELARVQNLNEMVADLRRSAADIQRITARVDRGEGAIGQLLTENGTSDRITTTLSSVSRVMKNVSRTELSLQAASAGKTNNQGLESTFGLQLQTPARNQLYLGLVHNTVVAGEPLEQDLSVDLQLTKAFGPLGLRGGLFSSTLGVALDYTPTPWFQLSGESENYGFDFGPTFNLQSQLKLYGPLWLWTGVEAMNHSPSRNYFGGVSFNLTAFGGGAAAARE